MNPFQGNNRKTLPHQKNEDSAALKEKRKAIAARLIASHRTKPQPAITSVGSPTEIHTAPIDTPASAPAYATHAPRYGGAQVSVYREGESRPSLPSPGLAELVDLYLDVAHHRSRKIALVWPAAPRELLLVHTLATLERWKVGDKKGVRGAIFPAKSNIFYPLNHLQLDRTQVLSLTRQLIDLPYAPATIPIVREHATKNTFLLWLYEATKDMVEPLNPTLGDLLPRYYADSKFTRWESCSSYLLQHMATRIRRRMQKDALRADCADIGDPNSAPDALFALDGRMARSDLRNALQKLAKCGPPDVILVNATRTVRTKGHGWDKGLARFCGLVEEVFNKEKCPGILVITDAPPAAFRLREQLKETYEKQKCWNGPQDFWIQGICNGALKDGLLEPGADVSPPPIPRTLDAEVVDTEANRIIARLYRIGASITQSYGREVARPVHEAAGYLSRMSALPCGVGGLTEWLSLPVTSELARRAHDWTAYSADVKAFANSAEAGEHKRALLECVEQASILNNNYQRATPFALRMAALVKHYVIGEKKPVALVYTSAVYRRLSEKFLRDYDDYSDDVTYDSIASHIEYVMADELENCLDKLKNWQLIFCGLDDNSLRILMLDDRIDSHTCVLLTTRAGQYLKATLTMLVDEDNFPAFEPLKPRMESLLRNLKKLPNDKSILSLGDFALPTFRRELATDISDEPNSENDPEACRILLEDGQVLLRRASHGVYVYDPANEVATDVGFRSATVQTLKPGDRLFVMSPELRELVESSLKAAGVRISKDFSFEGELRAYHQEIDRRVDERFKGINKTDRVHRLRNHMLQKLREAGKTKMADDFPGVHAVGHWIDTKDSAGKPFEQLRPQAPQKEAYFSCMMDALEVPQLQAVYYWLRVILPIRNARRQDGRQVSDIYAHMLMQPESAMLNANIPRATLKMLFSKARDNVLVVESVEVPKESQSDE